MITKIDFEELNNNINEYHIIKDIIKYIKRDIFDELYEEYLILDNPKNILTKLKGRNTSKILKIYKIKGFIEAYHNQINWDYISDFYKSLFLYSNFFNRNFLIKWARYIDFEDIFFFPQYYKCLNINRELFELLKPHFNPLRLHEYYMSPQFLQLK
jgi:hypothetical protein